MDRILGALDPLSCRSCQLGYGLLMLEKLHLPTDVVSILAFIFGAAVVIPSVIALAISLLTVGGMLF